MGHLKLVHPNSPLSRLFKAGDRPVAISIRLVFTSSRATFNIPHYHVIVVQTDGPWRLARLRLLPLGTCGGQLWRLGRWRWRSRRGYSHRPSASPLGRRRKWPRFPPLPLGLKHSLGKRNRRKWRRRRRRSQPSQPKWTSKPK